MKRLMGAAVLALASITTQSHAETPNSKESIRQIVHEYIITNPEVIAEALDILRTRQQAEYEARGKVAVEENADALWRHPMSPVSGNVQGDVTVVEFFDYQCGYCKRALPMMEALLESDANVRVIWKELPILGPISEFGAAASMGAQRQDLYLAFHTALMREPELSEERVMEIAQTVGLDTARLRQDMTDPAFKAYMMENRALAQRLGIEGTPAFVVGGTLVPGAIGIEQMRQIIAEAR